MEATFGQNPPTNRSEYVIGGNRHFYAIREINPSYRRSQAFFNYFSHWFPDVKVPPSIDPYFDPENLPQFNDWVEDFLESHAQKKEYR